MIRLPGSNPSAACKRARYTAAVRQRDLHRALYDLYVIDDRGLRYSVGFVAGECQCVDASCKQFVACAIVEINLLRPAVMRPSSRHAGRGKECQVAGRIAWDRNGRYRIGLSHLLYEVPKHSVAIL
jgi:hypothetical protein